MVTAGSVLFGVYALFAALAAPVVGVRAVVGGGVLFTSVQYALGRRLVLRSVGASDLSEDEYYFMHRRFEALSAERGIQKPRLMVGRMDVPEAFAVGRRGASVVVLTESLLRLRDGGDLSDGELEDLLAHELARVENHDAVVMLLGMAVASVLGLTVFFVVRQATDDLPIIGFVVGWFTSLITQALVMASVLAIERYREVSADEAAARPPVTPHVSPGSVGR
jgi:heat shock protein HtpX